MKVAGFIKCKLCKQEHRSDIVHKTKKPFKRAPKSIRKSIIQSKILDEEFRIRMDLE